MGFFTKLFLNVICVSFLLISSAKSIPILNQVEPSIYGSNEDIPLKLMLLSGILDPTDYAEKDTEPSVSNQPDHFLSLPDVKLKQQADQNGKPNSFYSTYVDPVKQSEEQTQNLRMVAKRNPETELLKMIMSLKNKNRMTNLSKKIRMSFLKQIL